MQSRSDDNINMDISIGIYEVLLSIYISRAGGGGYGRRKKGF